MTDDDFTPVSAPSRDGWPDRYFAVIFTAQRTLSDEDMYSLTAERMVELAQQQPGFLGVESVRGGDGIGITVSSSQEQPTAIIISAVKLNLTSRMSVPCPPTCYHTPASWSSPLTR